MQRQTAGSFPGVEVGQRIAKAKGRVGDVDGHVVEAGNAVGKGAVDIVCDIIVAAQVCGVEGEPRGTEMVADGDVVLVGQGATKLAKEVKGAVQRRSQMDGR